MTLTNEQRILNVINRRDVDFLPSQITMADRTRDKELSIQLGLSSAAELDSYMGNHIHITFSADDVPLMLKIMLSMINGELVYRCMLTVFFHASILCSKNMNEMK